VDLEIRRFGVVVATLVILGWAAAAHAEDTSRVPHAARTLVDAPIQLVLPQAHLLGAGTAYARGSRTTA